MKRYILLTLMALALHMGSLFAQSAQPREKSEVEVFMQQVAKVVAKSNEIDYSYISTNMFKQILSQLLSIVNDEAKEEMGIDKIFGSAMYMRRFISTGTEGYKLLEVAMNPFWGFLEEKEVVMDMELCALNRQDGVVSMIYGNSENVLVINNNHKDLKYSIVFVAGLSYEAFMKMNDSGIDLGF
ncbi:MAG: hypothetical protein J6C18_10280 [Bacteroidaceae bacterium]|nr:hypothetical protein [Bacteroidaceae bacterium]